MLALTLEFPDPVVGFPAQVPDAVGQPLDHMPELGGDEPALSLVYRHAVDDRAKDIELPLGGRAVADANRLRPIEPRQMLEVLLGQMRVAIDAIKDLHRKVMVVGTVADPVDEVDRFLFETGAKECGD